MTNEKNLYLYISLKYYLISKNFLNRIELVKTKIKLIITKNKKQRKERTKQNKTNIYSKPPIFSFLFLISNIKISLINLMYFDYSLVLREFESEFGMSNNSIHNNKKGLVLVLTFFQENLLKNY